MTNEYSSLIDVHELSCWWESVSVKAIARKGSGLGLSARQVISAMEENGVVRRRRLRSLEAHRIRRILNEPIPEWPKIDPRSILANGSQNDCSERSHWKLIVSAAIDYDYRNDIQVPESAFEHVLSEDVMNMSCAALISEIRRSASSFEALALKGVREVEQRRLDVLEALAVAKGADRDRARRARLG